MKNKSIMKTKKIMKALNTSIAIREYIQGSSNGIWSSRVDGPLHDVEGYKMLKEEEDLGTAWSKWRTYVLWLESQQQTEKQKTINKLEKKINYWKEELKDQGECSKPCSTSSMIGRSPWKLYGYNSPCWCFINTMEEELFRTYYTYYRIGSLDKGIKKN